MSRLPCSISLAPPPPRSTLFPYTTLFRSHDRFGRPDQNADAAARTVAAASGQGRADGRRWEEHTSELQSHHDLVCRLLLEKKNIQAHLWAIQSLRTNSSAIADPAARIAPT